MGRRIGKINRFIRSCVGSVDGAVAGGGETPALLSAPLPEGLAALVPQADRDSAIAPARSSA